MGRLGNDRAELYAKHRAKGMTPAKAAPAAGYSPNSSTTHLESDPEIRARIDELRAEYDAVKEQQTLAAREAAKVVGQLAGYGRAWVIQQLAEVAGLAKNDGEYKDAVNALELIGKDFGMFKGTSEDERGDVPQTTNIDALTALVGSAHDALPPEAEDVMAQLVLTEAESAELIAGQKRTEADKPRAADEEDEQFVPAADDDDPIDFDALRRSLAFGEDEDTDDEPSDEHED